MSLLLRPELTRERLPLLTLASGVAAAQAVEQLTDQAIKVLLKWPNDLYLHGRKLGGILTETGPFPGSGTGCPFIVIGVGINVNTRRESFPPGLREIVISLYDTLQRSSEIDRLIEPVVQNIQAAVAILHEKPQDILRSWRSRDYLLGRTIHWRDDLGMTLSGTASGLLDDGCYELTEANGTKHAVLAGDLALQPD